MGKNYQKIFLIDRTRYNSLNSFKPEKIEDLEGIFYNPCRSKDRTRYSDSLRTNVLSPNLERSTKEIFKLNDLTKIDERRDIKTFDFCSKSKKILLEITSINFDGESSSRVNIAEKIHRAVKHIGGKNNLEFFDYSRGGMIEYSSILAHFYDDLTCKILDKNFIIPIMNEQKLDYVLFRPEEASMGYTTSLEKYPSALYVKKEISEKFFDIDFITKITFEREIPISDRRT